MKKKLLGISGIIFVLIIVMVLSFPNSEKETEITTEVTIEADVVMPTKVSRPGCEETDSCYIPSKIFASINEEIVWINEDAAFHSVTSGSYEQPTELFDSGHLDPGQTFTLIFDEAGTYDYFCTLHSWMQGQIIIE